MLRGAGQIFTGDRHPDRLRLAESIGAIAIDDDNGSPVDQVLELTNGRGTDRGCECVGYGTTRTGRPRPTGRPRSPPGTRQGENDP
jgi:threonine dehydrogenase-like Zn-dependent dehydrogenase